MDPSSPLSPSFSSPSSPSTSSSVFVSSFNQFFAKSWQFIIALKNHSLRFLFQHRSKGRKLKFLSSSSSSALTIKFRYVYLSLLLSFQMAISGFLAIRFPYFLWTFFTLDTTNCWHLLLNWAINGSLVEAIYLGWIHWILMGLSFILAGFLSCFVLRFHSFKAIFQAHLLYSLFVGLLALLLAAYYDFQYLWVLYLVFPFALPLLAGVFSIPAFIGLLLAFPFRSPQQPVIALVQSAKTR